MRFQSKLLIKAYGLDIGGDTTDQQQDNIRDKNNPVRNPDKLDVNPANSGLDGTADVKEEAQIQLAHDSLNPHVPPQKPLIPSASKSPASGVSLQG